MTDRPRNPQVRPQTGDGPDYWRSLEELADTPEFRAHLEDEFPHLADLRKAPVDRRQALRLMAASAALAGVSGCKLFPQPREEIVPYVEMPEYLVPGEPRHYASAFALSGYAEGVVVESREGRPIKVEGNVAHPASLGATSLFSQATVLGLYDPERSRAVLHDGQIDTWSNLVGALWERTNARGGEGLCLLTPAVTSATLTRQIADLMESRPGIRWFQHEAVSRDTILDGSEAAFGKPLEPLYQPGRARVILSLDADFLGSMPGHLAYARRYAEARAIREPGEPMLRHYALDTSGSITAAKADHRLALRPSEVAAAARQIAGRLGIMDGSEGPLPARWAEVVTADLRQAGREALVVAGPHQPAAVHVLAHAMNANLGSIGQTVSLIAPVTPGPRGAGSGIAALAQEMALGRVETLLILGGNPAYDAPGDVPFADLLSRVPMTVHIGPYVDETAALCKWHVPQAHVLESWSDARAFDGTLSIVQPLIRPLHGGRTDHELLDALRAPAFRTSRQILLAHWAEAWPAIATEDEWRRTLSRGVLEGSAAEPQAPSFRLESLGRLAMPPRSEGLEVRFLPDTTVWDGRFANNAWLQELPKPMTLLSWDNALMISPATAEAQDLHNGDRVSATTEAGSVEAPVWIVPGHADEVVTAPLGYGRRQAGSLGTGRGFDAYAIRPADHLWMAAVRISRLEGTYPLATVQHHHSMEGREIVRAHTLEAFRADPEAFHKKKGKKTEKPLPSLYPEMEPPSTFDWGMTIDLTACIGCNACMVACQAENNIPVVGKEQLMRAHNMHWLRVDRYYSGPPEAPDTSFQPVPCMHCENAPCEYVCPVEATVHDAEGLNVMVYNRCIGTRDCSQNCPYKVRRFNWHDYNYEDAALPTPDAVRNPDVTVRARGVMEKCTYCIQRISRVRIEFKIADRPVPDGAVVTACQAACPADAISFGNLNDRQSRVRRLKETPRNYDLLEELNTRPRTSYLGKLTNPHPELARRRREDEKKG